MQTNGTYTFYCLGQTFQLHPFRAIYWVETSALLIADLHLGKVTHFRRAGIPIPPAANDGNWDRLLSLLIDYTPQKVLFLGDLFHSEYNAEWDVLQQLTQQFDAIVFGLVLGNHDRLEPRHYRQARLEVYEEPMEWGPFLFSHHPLEGIPAGQYNLAGHIHPCAHLQGSGRQRLRLPCFYFGRQRGLLPAFGAFTGMSPVEVRENDQVFVIAENRVLPVNSR